ncbi:5410_t:CDS:2 [Ambispora gerdemannii]|uniref:5410_t:CDS:1 n=1 Tax=Ambispora gerdemannii TaxID=144530 RepID=A0A9N9C3I9_9GLOM|nr:5410_t:CDS:2 [Ambispora gerdemannii]
MTTLDSSPPLYPEALKELESINTKEEPELSTAMYETLAEYYNKNKINVWRPIIDKSYNDIANLEVVRAKHQALEVLIERIAIVL